MISKSCRIIVPIYRSKMTSDEEVSLASIRKRLSGYGICFVAPQSLDLSLVVKDGETIERFSDEFFAGIEGYNRLLKSSVFYERFSEYDYILIAQLDCLIFSSDLNQWMAKGYDYLAAPWFKGFGKDHRPGLWRVGNGGLSLRRVNSYLRILGQKIVSGSIYPRWGHYAWKPPLESLERGIYTMISAVAGLNPFSHNHAVENELQKFPYNEDVFWAIEAPKYDPAFRVAQAEEALPFAFEVSPRWSYERNREKLPFGCHAWGKYDRDFWENILNKKF
jgi:Protein of unknown function (DUF5672)